MGSKRGGEGGKKRASDDGLQGKLHLKSYRKQRLPALGPGLLWAAPPATLTAQQVAETILVLMASRWRECNQHVIPSAHRSPRDLNLQLS